MDIIRLHCNSDGQALLETVEIPMKPEDEFGHLIASFPTSEVVFCAMEANFEMDWHPAPRRQLVVILKGTMEIELRDGAKHLISAGQILLAEDTGGEGHKTRSVGEDALKIAIIPLL